MKFSLILATVGRTIEVDRFLTSLNAQGYRNFELIVVDQNEDGRLKPILDQYTQCFPIIHLYSDRGLSRARNVGLKYITGDIIGFPDDDCWYRPDLLKQVANFFQSNECFDGYCGKLVDESGMASLGKFDAISGPINRYNIWRRGTSITIFLTRRLVQAVGQFDQSLGVGAGTLWGSAEDIDYPLRAIKTGFRLYYDPDLVVGHPNTIDLYTPEAISRVFLYGAGMGRVLRKHGYPFWFVFYQWARPLGGTLLALCTGNIGKARHHWARFKGRIFGWKRYM